MEKITILGAGVSGLSLVEKIREKDADCKIRLIDKNNYYFAKEEIISHPENFRKRIKLTEWAEDNNVEFINNSVNRINLKRRRIYFDNGEPSDFRELVIATGLVSKKMVIKGSHREGFFYLSDMDPLKLKDLLRLCAEVVIFVSTFLGVRAALALRALGKEVRIVCSNLDFVGEDKARVIDFLKENEMLLYFDSLIEEAVGESKVKATKILPLKAFPSQLVIIDSGFVPNLNFFEEEIFTNGTFFTNFEGVFLLGDVNDSEIGKENFFTYNHENARQQGLSFAEFIVEGKRSVHHKKIIEENDVKDNIENILKEGKIWQSGLV